MKVGVKNTVCCWRFRVWEERIGNGEWKERRGLREDKEKEDRKMVVSW